MLERFDISDSWRGKHWHAYVETKDNARSLSRYQRLNETPSAVRTDPDAVAEWIERRAIELGEQRKVRAVADKAWVDIGDSQDLAHLYGENFFIASRGDSI